VAQLLAELLLAELLLAELLLAELLLTELSATAMVCMATMLHHINSSLNLPALTLQSGPIQQVTVT